MPPMGLLPIGLPMPLPPPSRLDSRSLNEDPLSLLDPWSLSSSLSLSSCSCLDEPPSAALVPAASSLLAEVSTAPELLAWYFWMIARIAAFPAGDSGSGTAAISAASACDAAATWDDPSAFTSALVSVASALWSAEIPKSKDGR
ncbi:Uncharacterised protein [Mycobacteroides abscessus subsp. abscessus]|nr:Uncharacterised protein [Mycobacteroides abscessus subsp. abscessus]